MNNDDVLKAFWFDLVSELAGANRVGAAKLAEARKRIDELQKGPEPMSVGDVSGD